MKGADFSAADSYYTATREFWAVVMAQWQQYWARSPTLNLTAHSDQSGAFADLFELADRFAAGELKREQAPAQIRAVLGKSGVEFR